MYALLRILGFFSLTRDVTRAASGHPDALEGQIPRAIRFLRRRRRARFSIR
jgi:hypothetical protein